MEGKSVFLLAILFVISTIPLQTAAATITGAQLAANLHRVPSPPVGVAMLHPYRGQAHLSRLGNGMSTAMLLVHGFGANSAAVIPTLKIVVGPSQALVVHPRLSYLGSLGSRRRSERIGIVTAVHENPGIRYRELQREVDAADGTFAHHIDDAVRSGRIVRVQVNGRTHFFDAGLHKKRDWFMLTPQQRDMLDLIEHQGGSTEGALMRALGLGRSDVSRRLSGLRASGWVDRFREGHRLIWYRLRWP